MVFTTHGTTTALTPLALAINASRSFFQWLVTHWGRVTHICVSKLTIIGIDNGLSPVRCQAIILTNAGMLLIRTFWTNVGKFHTFSCKKMHLKTVYEMAAILSRPQCVNYDNIRCTKAFVLKQIRFLNESIVKHLNRPLELDDVNRIYMLHTALIYIYFLKDVSPLLHITTISRTNYSDCEWQPRCEACEWKLDVQPGIDLTPHVCTNCYFFFNYKDFLLRGNFLESAAGYIHGSLFITAYGLNERHIEPALSVCHNTIRCRSLSQWVNSVPTYVRKLHFVYEVVRTWSKCSWIIYHTPTSLNTLGRT